MNSKLPQIAILSICLLILACGGEQPLGISASDGSSDKMASTDVEIGDGLSLDTKVNLGVCMGGQCKCDAGWSGACLIEKQTAPLPEWNILSGGHGVLSSQPSFAVAFDQLLSNPRNRAMHVGAEMSFNSPAGFVAFVEELQLAHEGLLLNSPNTVDVIARGEANLASLDLDQRRWFLRNYRPYKRTMVDLQIVKQAILDEQNPNKVWGLLRIFVETLFTSTDNRFGDADGDEIPNNMDGDYDGVLWSNGPVTVQGDGNGGSSILIGNCILNCAPIPDPGCPNTGF